MAEQRVPSKGELEKYLGRGMTQAEIAAAWRNDSGESVSRSAIGMAILRYGLQSSKPRPRYADLLPWVIKLEHRNLMDAKMLRAEARRRAGHELKGRYARDLELWKRRLKEVGAVIHYDADTVEGFHWVRPEEGDDDLIHYPDSDSRSPRHVEPSPLPGDEDVC